MKVILAGYSKTGTKTMATAFDMLGYNTYDFLENYYYLHREWMRVFDGSATNEDIKKMFDGVDALTDAPVFSFWEELHQTFPEAKIILTIRDEDKWYKSLMKQIETENASYSVWLFSSIFPQGLIRRPYNFYTGRYFGKYYHWPSSSMKPHSEKILRSLYREHNDYVIKKAPKDKLLVYKVSEGWGPLCEFLGVEIPDKPFPHRNKSGEIIQEWLESSNVVHKILLEGALSVTAMSVVACFVGYKFYKSTLGENISNWISKTLSSGGTCGSRFFQS